MTEYHSLLMNIVSGYDVWYSPSKKDWCLSKRDHPLTTIYRGAYNEVQQYKMECIDKDLKKFYGLYNE